MEFHQLSRNISNQKIMPETIGWKEWLALPELGVPAIKAKVDTGAKTSALHAFKLEFFTEEGREFVRFWLHPLQKNTEIEVVCVAPVADRRVIRDSGGHEEEPVLIRGKQWLIEVSLASRENMSFRMLLGRSAMRRGNVLVDPSRSYVSGKRIKKIYTKTRKTAKNNNRVKS
ncbi:MAG: protein of unknown function DUF785 [Gammaproteobacteria bacterium]|nr:protein of unknown function DUF785 [Gammaproteobacteria bacterium]